MRRPPTLAAKGMVVCSHPLAAEAGMAILRAGGHAVDAAVAAAAVLSVVEPWASGLGGDAFFLIGDRSDGEVAAINGSGAAPSALSPDRFAGLSAIPVHGPLSFTVPGAVSAWGEAWYGWGRLAWRDLLKPAQTLAAEGFPVSWRMEKVLRREAAAFPSDPVLSRLYVRADGSPLRAGEICRNEALSATLKLLAEEGWEDFYAGKLAARLCRGVKAAGGVLTEADLSQHESALVPPYEHALRSALLGSDELVLYEQPLPSQGILLPFMLGLMEAGDGRGGNGDETAGQRGLSVSRSSWVELHRQIEAVKVAFPLRDAFLTDPRFLPVSERDLVDAFLSPSTLHHMARLSESEVLLPELAREVALKSWIEASPGNRDLAAAYARAGMLPVPSAEGGNDTTYLCTADGEGNVVSLIQSIFHPFGCAFVEPSTGILLNNRASGFSLEPADVNVLAPGKRTRHTLNSFLVFRDGKPWMAGGTPGADQQVQTNLQVLRHVLHGSPCWTGPAPMTSEHWSQARRLRPATERMPDPELLCAALEAPRIGVQPDGTVRYESRFAAENIRRLRKQGHSMIRIGPWEGSGFFQAIRCLDDGVLLGATDPRGEGLALGM